MAPKEQYSRADVRRQFGVTERQLRSWERQDLLAAAESYSFSDLIAVKTIVKAVDRADNHPANRFSFFVFALSCIKVASNQIFGNRRKNS